MSILLILDRIREDLKLEIKKPRKLRGLSTAYGIRTRITTVKGWCPSP